MSGESFFFSCLFHLISISFCLFGTLFCVFQLVFCPIYLFSSLSVYSPSCFVYFDCNSACSIRPHLALHILAAVQSFPSVLHLVLCILTVILFVPYLFVCALGVILSVPYVKNLSCIFCLFRILLCIIAAIKSVPSVHLLVLHILTAIIAVLSTPCLVLHILADVLFILYCVKCVLPHCVCSIFRHFSLCILPTILPFPFVHHLVLPILAAVISVPSLLRTVLQSLPGNVAVRVPVKSCALFSCVTFDWTMAQLILKVRTALSLR